MTYAVVQDTTLVGWGEIRSIHPNQTSHDSRFTVVSLDGLDPQPERGWFYDYAAETFQQADPGIPPRPKPTMDYKDFWFEVITADERTKAFAAINGENLAGVTIGDERWRLQAWEHSTLNGVNVSHDETEWAVNAMEQVGILGAGRAIEILE